MSHLVTHGKVDLSIGFIELAQVFFDFAYLVLKIEQNPIVECLKLPVYGYESVRPTRDRG